MVYIFIYHHGSLLHCIHWLIDWIDNKRYSVQNLRFTPFSSLPLPIPTSSLPLNFSTPFFPLPVGIQIAVNFLMLMLMLKKFYSAQSYNKRPTVHFKHTKMHLMSKTIGYSDPWSFLDSAHIQVIHIRAVVAAWRVVVTDYVKCPCSVLA